MRYFWHFLASGKLFAADAPTPATPQPPAPGEWVEADFPFFSSVLDARKAGPEFSADNLTPRGLILNLGLDCWVCFDVDLLRVSAMWQGKGVTARALAPGSYHQRNRKTPGGQTDLPTPDGKIWVANGIYPGWQMGDSPSLSDPREPAPSRRKLVAARYRLNLGDSTRSAWPNTAQSWNTTSAEWP